MCNVKTELLKIERDCRAFLWIILQVYDFIEIKYKTENVYINSIGERGGEK